MYYGSYKAPREILWILRVVIYLLMMATAFMGYVRPWGQMSFWGATVITGFFSAIPLVGAWIQELLLGGFAVDNPTLNRFFSLHYLLPFMLAAVVFLHIWALHVVGQNNPDGVEVKNYAKDTVPFTPYATVKDAFGMVCFIVFFGYFVFFMPNYLGHPDNYIPANPMVTPAHIVPEWYYLPFYAILRSIPDKLTGVIAMFAAIAVLAFLPWLDTSRVRSLRYRPTARIFFWVFVVVCFLLGYCGSQATDKAVLTLGGKTILDIAGFGAILTGYYFIYFIIILPVLGLFEKTKAEPASIADAVLQRHQGAGASAGAAHAPDRH